MFYTDTIFDDILRFRNVLDTYFDNLPGVNYSNVEFPYINLYEKDDTLEIRSILPGVKAEDLNLELVDEYLVIEGERKPDTEEKTYLRRERTFGKFKKSIKLPYRVNGDSIKADLKEGILRVTLQKSEEAKPKKIEIH